MQHFQIVGHHFFLPLRTGTI